MKTSITFSMLLYSIVASAQVSIGSVQHTISETQETKTPTYDSLSDFEVQENPQNYSQYVGHQFYLPPKIDGTNPPPLYSIHSKITSVNSDDIYDNYYTLTGGVTGAILKSKLTDDKLYNYHSNNFIQISRYPNFMKPIYLVMKNVKTGDTLVWAPTSEREFIFVPYFVKQKSLYENKTFIYDSENPIDEIELLNTYHPKLNVQTNSKWTCKEVTLLKYSQVSDYVPKDRYVISYVFSNDKNQTFAKVVNPIYPDIIEPNGDYHAKYFISEKAFIKKQQDQNKKDNELKAKNNAAIAKQKENEKAKYQEWVKSYGKENADLIASGKVRVGMTREMCIYAWGPLFKVYKTVNDQGTFETYRYSLTQALYFENGILKQIEK